MGLCAWTVIWSDAFDAFAMVLIAGDETVGRFAIACVITVIITSFTAFCSTIRIVTIKGAVVVVIVPVVAPGLPCKCVFLVTMLIALDPVVRKIIFFIRRVSFRSA